MRLTNLMAASSSLNCTNPSRSVVSTQSFKCHVSNDLDRQAAQQPAETRTHLHSIKQGTQTLDCTRKQPPTATHISLNTRQITPYLKLAMHVHCSQWHVSAPLPPAIFVGPIPTSFSGNTSGPLIGSTLVYLAACFQICVSNNDQSSRQLAEPIHLICFIFSERQHETHLADVSPISEK